MFDKCHKHGKENFGSAKANKMPSQWGLILPISTKKTITSKLLDGNKLGLLVEMPPELQLSGEKEILLYPLEAHLFPYIASLQEQPNDKNCAVKHGKHVQTW